MVSLGKSPYPGTIVLLITAVFFLAGCSKGGHEPDNNGNSQQLSSDNSLKNFAFTQSSNPSLPASFGSIGSNGTIYITVPDGISLNNLVPSFDIHPKAAAKIGTTYVESGATPADFSKTVFLTVTAENGCSKTYTILAKNGDTKTDSRIYSFMVKHSVPGVSIAISKDEEIIYSAGYGFADTSKKERVTPMHRFRLASMSKQHAAIAIMKLVEQKKLNLTDTVFGKRGILYSAFGDRMPEKWKQVTVEHLLSHTSGIDPDAAERDCMFGNSIYYGKNTTGRIALLLENVKITNPPGKVYHYNNSNFGILGKIAEIISGKSFVQFLKDDIYTPIGITDIEGGNNDTLKDNEVNYYGQSGRNPFGNDVEQGVAAGGMIASTLSLMKLMSHIDYGTKVADIFEEATLDRMYTPLSGIKNTGGSSWNRYALGWQTNHTIFKDWASYHSGNLAGVSTLWVRGTDNVNAVILCNSRSYEGDDIDDALFVMMREIKNSFSN